MILTLTVKISKGREYLYFQAGKKSMYISPKDKPERARQENVVKAIEYAWERAGHYIDTIDELLLMLPEPLRKKYSTRQAEQLQNKASARNQSKKKNSNTD